jgi:hypothetical protein
MLSTYIVLYRLIVVWNLIKMEIMAVGGKISKNGPVKRYEKKQL